MNGVAVDLSPHPEVQWAVIYQGQLLPMRFHTKMEALDHLYGLANKIAKDVAALSREEEEAQP
ncbi:hypothetical protein [Bauldia litoralis]|uniref:hypothetical protein n=1 Tax=Bauldia litoralis TaxID=665467 RepID=UPI003265330A